MIRQLRMSRCGEPGDRDGELVLFLSSGPVPCHVCVCIPDEYCLDPVFDPHGAAPFGTLPPVEEPLHHSFVDNRRHEPLRVSGRIYEFCRRWSSRLPVGSQGERVQFDTQLPGSWQLELVDAKEFS